MKRRKPKRATKPRTRVNRRIRVPQVRLVDEDGSQLGVLETKKALSYAEEKGLDLVEVAPAARPPVCRVMDFGKFLYEQNKRQRETRKSHTVSIIKEIKIRVKTDDHDVNFKVAHIIKFLEQKHRVKVTVVFRGREITHTDRGRTVLKRVVADLAGRATVESEPRLEGRTMSMLLAPAKKSRTETDGE